MRHTLVLFHRYVGLAIALFIAVAGLTGSILAFNHEIDAWLNPEFYQAEGVGEPLPPGEIIERVEAKYPDIWVWYLGYPEESGEPAILFAAPRINPATGEEYDSAYNFFSWDAVTGEEIGKRYWMNCCFERENFIPFVYELHHNLMLPEYFGILLMGVVAILWVLDTLVSLFLTFPRNGPFFSKWWRFWKVKGGSTMRLNLDWHRVGGLWLWLILLPIAISSVAMNLPTQVFKPVVSIFSPVALSMYEERLATPVDERGETRISHNQAYQLALAEAKRLGWREPVGEYLYLRDENYFGVGFGYHDGNMLGNKWIYFEGTEGRQIGVKIPGEGTAGDVFADLQLPIHGGRIAGFPGRIIIFITGLGLVMLSGTGVYIWWRKRRARISSRQKQSLPTASAELS